jgi:hypothetical protein
MSKYQQERHSDTIVKVLITGSRTYPESGYASSQICATLDGLWQEGTLGYMTVDLFGFVVIEGGCPTGADAVARWWADNSPMHNYDKFPDKDDPWPDKPPFLHKRMDAKWGRYGKGAGPIRNQAMIDYLMEGDLREERLVIGFVDKPLESSDGTYDCIKKAKAAGLPHFVVRYYL